MTRGTRVLLALVLGGALLFVVTVGVTSQVGSIDHSQPGTTTAPSRQRYSRPPGLQPVEPVASRVTVPPSHSGSIATACGSGGAQTCGTMISMSWVTEQSPSQPTSTWKL